MERLKYLVQDEWSSRPFDSNPMPELMGIIESLPVVNKGATVLLSCSKLNIIRRFVGLWKNGDFSKIYSEGEERFSFWDKNLKKGGIELPFDVYHAIINIDIGNASSHQWQWMRGVFGAIGSLYFPKIGYYLLLRFAPKTTVINRVKVLFENTDFNVGTRKRDCSTELMLRNQEHVVTFLANIGLVRSSLAIEETAIMRSMKNRANKLVNCDSANIDKSLRAAQKQLALFEEIERLNLEDELPSELQELMDVRRANPSASLRELGQYLSRPVSKSTVEYRWRKLEALLNRTH